MTQQQQPRISFNVHADAPNFDRDKLWAYLDTYRPRWLLIMNATKFAFETALRYPDVNVIVRWQGRDDEPLKSWPTAKHYLDFVKADFAATQYDFIPANLWCNVANEAGDDDVLHRFFSDLIKQPELRFVVGGYSVGTPSEHRWDEVIPFLRLCSENRNRCVLALHEYFGVVPTSGFVGGAPNDPRHENYIPRSNWPENTSGLVKWHCGRFNFLLQACKAAGITPPRLILTEHGADDLGDIKGWTDMLPRTPPYQEIRGWRTLWNAWRSLYSGALDVELFYADSLIYLDKAVYKDTPVEAQLVFSWAAGQQWRPFDISDAGVFLAALKEYAGVKPTPPPTPTPDPVPVPTPTPTKAELLAFADDFLKLAGVIRDNAAGIMDMAIRFKELVEG